MTPRRRHRRRPAIETTRVQRVTARINDKISASRVRLIDENGEQLGVRTVAEALAYAEERDLDLVEVAAAVDPPVCRVADFGKWRYEEERRAREARRNQTHVSFKDVRLTPKIGAHDFEWKRNRAVEFLRGRAKVRVTVRFRGREREHPERGRTLLDRLVQEVAEWGHAEAAPTFDGRTMTLVIAPNGAER